MSLLMELLSSATPATVPIIGASDYGSSGLLVLDGLWARIVVSILLAAIVAGIGEAAIRLARKLRHH